MSPAAIAALAAYCMAVTLLTLLVLAVLFFLALIAGSVYAKNVFRAGDKTLAALLGFGGYHTLSYECGHGESFLCQLLRPCIDLVFGKGHCVGAPD